MKHLTTAALVLGLAAAAQAQGRDSKGGGEHKFAQDGIIWATSWEEALKEAQARNVPIHFTLHKDGWPPCQSMESSTYPDKKVIEMSRNFVNVAAHSETGHEKDGVVGGKRVTWCTHYWGISCEAHSKCYQQARNQYDGITGVPCTVIADPSGKEIARKAGGLSGSELVKFMSDNLNKVTGEKIDAMTWGAVKKWIADGDAALEKEDYKKAIELYQKAAKMKQKGLKAIGEEALKKVDEKGNALVEEGKGKIESEKEEAKKILKKVADNFKPLECSKKAADALKEIK